MTAPARVGVSACLLGRPVRYDGRHKSEEAVVDVLGRVLEFVPVCPELELGLGVPREPVHLAASAQGVRLVGVETGRDLTEAMERFSRRRSAELAQEGLCGFILKKDSPSCGAGGVKVHSPAGGSEGKGFFAAALSEAFPDLPVAEEDGLREARGREDFLERVFAYRRRREGLP